MSTSACCRSGSTREQRHALLHRVAFAHRQRLDPARFVGADKDQVGLDPALVTGSAGFEQPASASKAAPISAMRCAVHGASPEPSSTSKCARISARTSIGSKRSNKPLQKIATMPGAGEQLRKANQRVGLQLAALMGPAQHGADRLHHPRDHFAVVEFGELGKARTFGDDKADDILAARLENLAGEHLDQLIGDHRNGMSACETFSSAATTGLSSMRMSSSNSASLSAKCR